MTCHVSFSIFVIVLLFAAARTLVESSEDGIHKFTYSGSNGPANWASLDPSFSSCSSGKKQSPINIIRSKVEKNKDLKALDRQYKPANATLMNYGFSVGVVYDAECGGMELNGESYELKQMHWHTPSDHQIDGKQFPLELHLVHKTNNGNISVIAVLHKFGKADPLLAMMKTKLDKLAKESGAAHEIPHIPLGVMDNKALKRKTRTYFRYVGSLTTPPCTEGVIWNVVSKVRTVSKEQVEALRDLLDNGCKKNSRPLQLLNNRKVEMCDDN